jgi:hypothetical protein
MAHPYSGTEGTGAGGTAGSAGAEQQTAIHAGAPGAPRNMARNETALQGAEGLTPVQRAVLVPPSQNTQLNRWLFAGIDTPAAGGEAGLWGPSAGTHTANTAVMGQDTPAYMQGMPDTTGRAGGGILNRGVALLGGMLGLHGGGNGENEPQDRFMASGNVTVAGGISNITGGTGNCLTSQNG